MAALPNCQKSVGDESAKIIFASFPLIHSATIAEITKSEIQAETNGHVDQDTTSPAEISSQIAPNNANQHDQHDQEDEEDSSLGGDLDAHSSKLDPYSFSDEDTSTAANVTSSQRYLLDKDAIKGEDSRCVSNFKKITKYP